MYYLTYNIFLRHLFVQFRVKFLIDKQLSERVLTQHGLSGIPSAKTRIGTSSEMRQIKDIRYWQSHLQMKMDEIRKETERLVRENMTMDREKSAKRTFEKKVKESTRGLTGTYAF